MKSYIIILSLFLALMFPSVSLADTQSILSMEELSIHVMPEYAYHPNDKEKDHAPLLIGYQGSMLNNSDQPQRGQIEIPLPMKEKNFRIGYAADYSSNLSKAYEIEYMINREKGTISWTTSEEIAPHEPYKFVIEYYTDSLKVNKEKKTFSYQFKSFANIGLVNISITKPAKAEKMKLKPAPEKNQNHADGDQVVSYLFQNVKAGDEKVFQISYERKETLPTTELMKAKSLDQQKDNKKNDSLAVGAFSGISIISVGALVILLRKKKQKRM
jgi:hypothetical protein